MKSSGGLTAVESLRLVIAGASTPVIYEPLVPGSWRLGYAGGYDPRLQDNIQTLQSLLELSKTLSLGYAVLPSDHSSIQLEVPAHPEILFLLNFTTLQRSALLTSPATLALLYTPTNEHFGIGPVEGMVCGLPVLACRSGGPKESILDMSDPQGTGWLCEPEVGAWSEAMLAIVKLSRTERGEIAQRAKRRAREKFGMDVMARELEQALVEAASLGPVRVLDRVLFFVFGVIGVCVGLFFLPQGLRNFSASLAQKVSDV